MRRRRSDSDGRVFLAFLTISALVHVLLAEPLSRGLNHLFEMRTPAPPVKVVRLSADQWDRNFQTKSTTERRLAKLNEAKPSPIAATPTPPKTAKKKEEPKAVKPHGQVVKVPPTKDDTPDPNARFASRYNTRVDKETTARREARDPKLGRVTNKLQHKNATKAIPKDAIRTRGLTMKGDDRKRDAEGKPGTGKPKLIVPDILRRDGVAIDPSFDDDLLSIRNRNSSEGLLGNGDRLEIAIGGALDGDGKGGDDGGKRGAKNGADKTQPLPTLSALVPSFGASAQISGSPSRDVVEGVPEGEGTFLNTKEFKYATFIYRVGDSVVPYWESYLDTEYRRRDPSGRIYGQKDRATLIQIELNLAGELEDVHVAAGSGVDFLDEVVIRAIRKAQPFPNPPHAMADPDGKIRLSYRFIVSMTPKSGFGMFRRLR